MIDSIKRLWSIPIRGTATFRKQALGWYSEAEGGIRLQDVRDVTTALHELGHHLDRQIDKWSRQENLPSGIAEELTSMGKSLYGKKKPNGGYRAEGFAEFIREYLTGGDTASIAPKMYEWFSTVHLPNNPAEAKKLRKLELLVTDSRTQGAEARIRAFRSPIKQDWSASRIVARSARWFGTKWRDLNLPLVHAMKDAGIDIDSLGPSKNPYTLATAYSMSASSKAAHAILEETTDLAGTRTGKSLRDAMEPVSAMGKDAVEQFKNYVVARRAIDLHTRGINPGISLEDAQEVIKLHSSDVFQKAAQAVTDWSRRQLKLLIDAGVMTQKDFDQMVETNPVYVPFSRQFEKGEIRGGDNTSKGGGVYKIKGSGREIHDPIDALIWQSERIHQTAMQADMIKSLVSLYDKNKGGKHVLANLMAEVPAPQEAMTFSAEQIKRDLAALAVDRLGADPSDVAAAMLDTWDSKVTVFTKGNEYKGKENIVSVVIDGQRRFFEVQPELFKILGGLNKRDNIGGVAGEIARQAVRLQRLGATGLNPGFGLVRNPIRDTATAMITFDYAKGGPFASMMGIIEDVVGSESERRYHAMGVDLAGWIGQDKRKTKSISRNVTAVTKKQKVMATAHTPIHALRTFLGVTEAGPRLAEFKAAYKYGMDKFGNKKDAAILASVAGKDVTVNFSRSGEWGRKLNEAFLFFNAGVQSIDKFGRTFYKHPARTVVRGAGMLTFMALINYYRNRDEDWWKELPPYEKWNYVHFSIPGTETVMRAPLPFEFGLVFAALPLAAIENTRTPGAFNDALGQLVESVTPSFVPAFLAPLAEVWRNEDWKGSPIVPDMIKKHRLPEDWYTARTTSLAKGIGKMIGQSPAQIEHILNGYSGGLYRRVAELFEGIADPTRMTGGPSNLPVIGTLFLRPKTSKLTNDFYTKMASIEQAAGSGKASLNEIGELTAMRSLSGELRDLWKQSREVITSGKSAADQRKKTEPIYDQIHEKLKEFNGLTQSYFELRGAGKLLISSTSPSADPDDIDHAAKMLSGKDKDWLVTALRIETKRRGHNTRVWRNGKRTAFGYRMAKLHQLLKDKK